MATRPQEELLSSLKQLYMNQEYSDLIITSRKKDYHVHKAIVCPRSKFFATEYRNTSSEESEKRVLNLRNDDAQAVEMVLRYLYYLDYPSVAPDEPARVNGHRSDAESPKTANGNGINHREDSIPEPAESRTDEPPESLDEFLPPNLTKSRNKRKKRKKSMSVAKAESEEPSEIPPAEGPLQGKWDEIGAAEMEPPAPPAEEEPEPRGCLTIHAKVYELSKKYCIDGLKTLSLEKFEKEAESQWVTEDFLQAAKEVYAPSSDKDDRSMKDMITQIVCQHPELLDKPETEKVIRGLELGYDVLMRVRKQGGFH